MFEQIRSNKRKSALLIVGFAVFVALIGGVVGYLIGGGPTSSIIALVIAACMAFG